MKLNNKLIATSFLLLLVTGPLVACGNSSKTGESKESKTSETKKLTDEEIAKTDAQTVLKAIYQNDTTMANDVSSESFDSMKQKLQDGVADKQVKYFEENGKLDDYTLIVDGSEYTAKEVINDYAKAYMKITATLPDVAVEKVEMNGDEATVTAKIRPIAGLSEANPIGGARTKIFGGLDNDTIIRQSQNKDVKQINRLITLKLYGVYYGDMGKKPPYADEETEINFRLKKSGNHYVADYETYKGLVKNSRAEVYGKTEGDDSNNQSSSTEASSEDNKNI